jgi:hypothetical protein
METGVPDIIDLDDDNDGIPDAVECPDLLSHGDFEHLTGLSNGNNIGVSILPWVLGTGQQANIVQVDGAGGYNYGQGGPLRGCRPGNRFRYAAAILGYRVRFQRHLSKFHIGIIYHGHLFGGVLNP